LFLAPFGAGIVLVEAGQVAIVAFVQGLVAKRFEVRLAKLIENVLAGHLRARQRGRVSDIELETGGLQALASGLGFGMALFGQARIAPAGEQVLEVPFALTVADQDESTRHMQRSVRERIPKSVRRFSDRMRDKTKLWSADLNRIGAPVEKSVVQPENIEHRIEAGLFAIGPKCGLDRTARKDRAVFGMMGENNALTGPGKNDRVLADDRTAAQGGEADGSGFTRSRIAVAHADAVFRQCNVASLRCRFAKQQGGAGWRIALVLVVHFKDFDIDIRRIERLRRLLHQNGQKIDAEAHITRLDDGCVAGSGADLVLVLSRAARRADDVHDARLCGEASKFDACRRACEIKNAV